MGKMTEAQPQNAFTLRAFLVGSFFSLFIAVGAPYANSVIKGSYMALDFSTGAAIFCFFLLVFGINTGLRAIRENLGLSRPELLTTYVMMIIACTIPTMGLMQYLLPIMPAAHYFATPENRWAEIIVPHIPTWIAPTDPQVLKDFYEGGATVPWRAWAGPLLAWSAFLLALYFVMICMVVIIRKQWVEKEKLTFPLVHLPLEMSQQGPGSVLGPFFKNKLMWIGFAIPAVIMSINALHCYYNAVPAITVGDAIPIFRQTVQLPFNLSFPMLGFSFILPTTVSFSLWFFSLFNIVERGILGITGFSINQVADIYTASCGDVIIGHQGAGAIILLVGMGLWVGRKHLKDVFRKATGRGADVDDSSEILSYPVAFWGMIAGLIFMGIWLNLSGTPVPVIPIFLIILFVFFLGVTRIVCEGGVALCRAPSIASFFVISGFGTGVLGPVGLVSMAFTWIYASDTRTFVMGSAATSLKLTEKQRKTRPLFWAIMLAIVLSMAGSIWIIMTNAYDMGGANLNSWFFGGGATAPFDFTITKMLNSTGPNWGAWGFIALGAAVMWFLMFMRFRFLWWPLHPIGLPAASIFLVQLTWLSVFLGWLTKSLLLRYGGPKLYRTIRPMFLGMVMGQFAMGGIWLIINYFTGMTNCSLFWI